MVHMRKIHRLRHFLFIKIAGIGTCAKGFTAHIYSIGAGVYRCLQCFPAACGSKQFYCFLFHMLSTFHALLPAVFHIWPAALAVLVPEQHFFAAFAVPWQYISPAFAALPLYISAAFPAP